MGVTGLWPLLEPVGRRVNVETLAGQRIAVGERAERRGRGRAPAAARVRSRALRGEESGPAPPPATHAVDAPSLLPSCTGPDASIWVHQFVKAMRDERGDPLPNAHLLGFFRRACRLLFHRVKPVFVFDGAAPELKAKTLMARRR